MRYIFALIILAGLIPGAALVAGAQNTPTPSRVKVTIRVYDPSGAPLSGDLVIVQQLGQYNEISRALSDDNGDVPALDLKPGLYRLIAGFPYFAAFQTVVREFLVAEGHPQQIVLKIPLTLHPDEVSITAVPVIVAKVLTSDGLPAAGATLFTRDADGTLIFLGKDDPTGRSTNSNGIATIELVAAPYDADTIVVVLYRGILYSQAVPKNTRSLVINLPKP